MKNAIFVKPNVKAKYFDFGKYFELACLLRTDWNREDIEQMGYLLEEACNLCPEINVGFPGAGIDTENHTARVTDEWLQEDGCVYIRLTEDNRGIEDLKEEDYLRLFVPGFQENSGDEVNKEPLPLALFVHGYKDINESPYNPINGLFWQHHELFSTHITEFPVMEPANMTTKLNRIVELGKYDYIIASSLGALYSLPVRGPKKILINPVIPDNLRALMKSDPEGNPLINDSLLSQLQVFRDYYFKILHDEFFASDTYLIFGTHDDIAPNEAFFRQFFADESHIFHADMGHVINEACVETVAKIISNLQTAS